MHVVFDLDGVLFDTQEAVRQAYLDAGAEMPVHAWGLPWQSWLIDIAESDEEAMRIHRLKDANYANIISHGLVQELPALTVARKLAATNLAEVGIMTGASRRTTELLITKHRLDHLTLYGTSMTARAKADALRGIAPRGVYIDDHDFAAVEGWRIIRYDHTVDGFHGLLEKLWTQ